VTRSAWLGRRVPPRERLLEPVRGAPPIAAVQPESINDEAIFEIEPIDQIEVDVD
jgi:hypothetical protein